MLAAWARFAAERGQPRPLIVAFINGFYSIDNSKDYLEQTDALLHFQPQAWGGQVGSVTDKPMPIHKPQYWGAYASFFNGPRRTPTTWAHFVVKPDEFLSGLQASLAAMATHSRPNQNLYFLTAWNEWNEQSVLEPDDRYGFAYLDAVKTAVNGVPARKRSGW